jgi:hypothetical protein
LQPSREIAPSAAFAGSVFTAISTTLLLVLSREANSETVEVACLRRQGHIKEPRAYLVYLTTERHLAPSTIIIAVAAL